jgi:hypothetical protein
MASNVYRIIWYSLQFATKDNNYRPYLDLINKKATTFITLIDANGLINIIEKGLKLYEKTAAGYDSSVKVVSFFDCKAYFIKENNHWMIVIGKFKHWGVKYNIKDNFSLFPRKNEVVGDKEIRWSMLVIFNNLKVLFKTANNAPVEYSGDVISKSNYQESITGLF